MDVDRGLPLYVLFYYILPGGATPDSHRRLRYHHHHRHRLRFHRHSAIARLARPNADAKSSLLLQLSLVSSTSLERAPVSITHDVLENPVVAEDGRTYDRAAIEHWSEAKHSSPITNKPMIADVPWFQLLL